MSEHRKDTASIDGGQIERLSSDELAALIVDALLRAAILKETDVRRAIAIATEEIEARKTMGDY
jgi:hypothetical protein